MKNRGKMVSLRPSTKIVISFRMSVRGWGVCGTEDGVIPKFIKQNFTRDLHLPVDSVMEVVQ